jgi:hypothetical protein
MNVKCDYLPILLFKHNINNAKIDITIPELRNAKELFLFLLDLLCKGLVYMFGAIEHGKSSVLLDDITMEQLEFAKQKMKCGGVLLNVKTIPNQTNLPCATNMGKLLEQSDDSPLSSYSLDIVTKSFIFIVSFDLV